MRTGIPSLGDPWGFDYPKSSLLRARSRAKVPEMWKCQAATAC